MLSYSIESWSALKNMMTLCRVLIARLFLKHFVYELGALFFIFAFPSAVTNAGAPNQRK